MYLIQISPDCMLNLSSVSRLIYVAIYVLYFREPVRTICPEPD